MGAQSSSEPVGLEYPETDHMGEGELQRLISELLRPLLAQFLASQGRIAHVGADQFLYLERGAPAERMAPDIYVLPEVPQAQIARSWKCWELPAPPAFILEIVSTDVIKDYEDGPEIYARMGVEELVVFDPEAPVGGVVHRDLERTRFQVFRREQGRFIRTLATNDDRVPSRWLGAWIRVVGEGPQRRLRVALGEEGDTLVPTADERAEAHAQRAEAETQRAEAETQRAEAETRRAEAEAQRAEAEKHRAEAEKQRADALELRVQALLEELARRPL